MGSPTSPRDDSFVILQINERQQRKQQMKKSILSIVAIVLMSSSVFAKDCVMNVDRVPQAGKEKEASSKCEPAGLKCDDPVKQTGSAEACLKAAKENCKIARPEIVKQRIITVKFDGKDLEGGKDVCK